MRLFIALALDGPVRRALCETVERLRAAGASGNFTRPENLHLTLHFLGEQLPARAKALGRLLDACDAAPFDLELSGFGLFPGGVCWVGLRDNPALSDLYARLGDALLRAGFPVDNRPYHPHLTLGREIRLPSGFDAKEFAAAVPPLRQRVTDVRLMRSRRVDGVLTYTPLVIRPLTADKTPGDAETPGEI